MHHTRLLFKNVLIIMGVAMIITACSGLKNRQKLDSFAEKSAPNDAFELQRMYPDTVFDWKGWRRAIQATKAQEQSAQRGGGCSSNTTNWTIHGPGNIGGRCNTLATQPGNDLVVLAGFAAGGIHKSSDGGINWHPVFDDQSELAIGKITFDPSNPNIVYAGTGDPNVPSILFNGNGLYKSTDAGETWHYLALDQVGIISKVIVSPNNPSLIWVGAMGNPHVRNTDRGIYRSTDGGVTFEKVLFVSNQAGASDLVMSPADPNILYASFWDRIRTNSESVSTGLGAQIWKSSDGGVTWVRLQNNLPSWPMGRTGLAISQTNPNKVYAIFVDTLQTPGGLYKTTDGGNSWTEVNIGQLEDSSGDFAWYFGKLRINPTNDEEFYFLAILNWRKIPGSNTFQATGNGHADSHDYVITPSGRRYWGHDGGVSRLEIGETVWKKCLNLNVTQFYHSSFNPHEPNVYWGGAQDNGVKKGNGAIYNAWTNVLSADGFRCAFEPNDPNIFWAEIQNGTIYKTTNGGASWSIGAAAFGSQDRVNWDAPFFMSKHNSNIFYAATYRLQVGDGSGFAPASADLTDGNILGARFHTISALDESPVVPQKLLVGTSDANVWRMEPTGATVNISNGLPNRYVTSVTGSTTTAQRIFVTQSGFRDNDPIPHVHRTDNNGQTWINISSNLPNIPVNDLLILPNHADSVIFIANDAGVYFTKNSGLEWGRLGGNMMFVPVFDLIENPVRKELVAATFGRGLWTFPLDSIFVQQAAPLISLSGLVNTETSEGVGNTFVNQIITNNNGNYTINNLLGCETYTLTPQRNDFPLNGVTTFDLVLMSKHILGIDTLDSPYKMIAADANKSGSITTFDIVQLRKLILGIQDTIPGNKSWRFVPSDFAFPNPNEPFQQIFPESSIVPAMDLPITNLDFIGIKIGDVNNSATPNLLSTSVEDRSKTLDLQMDDLSFEANQLVSVPFSMNLDGIIGFQATLNFDPKIFDFQGIEPVLQGMGMEHFALNRVKTGQITWSYDHSGTESMPSHDKILFILHLKSKKVGNLTASIYIDDSPTLAAAYQTNGTALRVQLNQGLTQLGSKASPNPFGSQGVGIDFEQPLSESCILSIYNGSGKVIFQKPLLPFEKNTFISAEKFPQKGIYWYQVNQTKNNHLLLNGKLVFSL